MSEETTTSAPEAPSTEAPAAPASAAPQQTWHETLSADIRNSPTLQKYKTPEAAARALLEAQRFIGGEKIPVPQDTWGEAEWNVFHNALGRPETVEGYDLEGFAPPDGLPWDGDFQGSMLEAMHGLGLSQKQARGLLERYAESMGEQMQGVQGEAARRTEEGLKGLRREWGNAFEAKLDGAQRLFRQATGDRYKEVADTLLADGSRLGDSLDVIRMFATLADGLGEHGFPGEKTSGRLSMTPQEAISEARRLQRQEGYTDKEHPDHEQIVQRVAELFEAAYPEEK